MTDDPHDDCTKWVGSLPLQGSSPAINTSKRNTTGAELPVVQCQKPPMET